YEKEPYKELPPASITKIMTLLLIMEAIEDERAELDDIVRVSENAMRMGGSQIYLEVGEEMTLNDLIKSIAIASANDSCVAVAEYLYGTEEAFVKKMNERAQQLKLENTLFVNSTGLPPDGSKEVGNYTCVRDIAVMSRELLKYPIILKWTSIWLDSVRNGEFVLNNTNKLVRHYQGVDGIKTGYTTAAKFCLSATGKRDGLRFVAVVMGAPTSDIRFKEVSSLLSYGFNTFKAYEVVKKDQIVQHVQISRGKVEEVPVIADRDFYVPLRKGSTEQVTTEVVLRDKIVAPISEGEILAELVVKKSGAEVGRVMLKSNVAVERGSIFRIIFQLLKKLFSSLVNLFK
ncbi:MAG: D-alanyl-D-alanine carboxypeptidase, partial [Desulfovibrionales bacterium]|nr:D-alanyl-D-alanine carboxypeptidase [Desulfovibrionales bacterium]